MIKLCLSLLLALFATALHTTPLQATETSPADGQAPTPLFNEIAALDTRAFDAFNHCSEPGRLEEHAGYFSPDVEFYHDAGGVTWTRDAMIANTKKYVCGRFTRQLIPGSLKVYPIKDFGALAQGVHRFCQLDSGKCEGAADFAIVWRLRDGQWQITRVLSYGHHALSEAQ